MLGQWYTFQAALKGLQTLSSVHKSHSSDSNDSIHWIAKVDRDYALSPSPHGFVGTKRVEEFGVLALMSVTAFSTANNLK